MDEREDQSQGAVAEGVIVELQMWVRVAIRKTIHYVHSRPVKVDL